MLHRLFILKPFTLILLSSFLLFTLPVMLPAQSTSPHDRVKTLREQGQGLLSNGQIDQAEDSLKKALSLSRAIFNRYEEAYSLYLLGVASARNEAFETAKERLAAAASIARNLQEKELEYRARNFLLYPYFMTDENFNNILALETEVYRLVNEIGTGMQKAQVYNNLGYDLTVAGTVPLDSTISLMNIANDTYARAEENKGRWYTLMNLAWQHRLKHDLEQSLKYAEWSLAQALAEEDRHAIVEAAFQLGETLIDMGKIGEAKPHYETGLKWRGEQEDRDRHVFDVYYARYLWEKGEKERAVSLLEQAVSWLAGSEVFYEMHGRALLALYYMDTGEPGKAAQHLELIENPRHNYISLESRCIAAIARARWFARDGRPEMGKALLESWDRHTTEIGAVQLNRMVKAAS